jgi:membrane protein
VAGWARRIVLPGFQGFSLWDVSKLYMRALARGALATRAAAISFKLFAAFFPTLLMLLTLAPVLPVDLGRGQLLRYLVDVLPPEVHRFLEETLSDLLLRPHGTLFSFSFLGSVYLASNSIDAILRGFRGSSNLVVWHRPLKQRLLSIGLLFVLTALLVVALPVLTCGDSAIRILAEHHFLAGGLQVVAASLLRWIIALGLMLFAIALLYHAGEPGRPRFRIVTPGAVVTVTIGAILSRLLGLFFRRFSNYNALYGSIGAILAVQLWLYANMLVLLVGHELNVAIGRARRESAAGKRRPRSAHPRSGSHAAH